MQTKAKPTDVLSVTVLILYGISCVVRAINNPSGAHGHRQIDTAGITVSLVQNFHDHGWAGYFEGLLYPRLLQRGLTSGVNVTELPLLSAITFPAFLISTRWGVLLSSILISVLAAFAALWALPRIWKAWGIKLPLFYGPLVYFSLVSTGFHSSIYMPEGFAFPIFVIGASFFCTPKHTWKSVLGAFALLSIAITIKPPMAVGFLPLFIWTFVYSKSLYRSKPGHGTKKDYRLWIVSTGIVALAMVLPLWWFKIHSREIMEYADSLVDKKIGGFSPYSYLISTLTTLSPLDRLRDIGLWGGIQLISRQLNFDNLPIYFGWLWVPLMLVLEPLLLGAMLVMLLAAMSLLGPAIWVHGYYFFGVSFISLIAMPKILTELKSRRVKALCLISLIWGVAYNCRTNIWISSRTIDYWKLSAPLIAQIPPEAHIITDDVYLCPTKLLTTSEPGTLAPDNLSTICNQAGYSDRVLAYLIDESTYKAELKKPGTCIKDARKVAQGTEKTDTWVLLILSRKRKTVL